MGYWVIALFDKCIGHRTSDMGHPDIRYFFRKTITVAAHFRKCQMLECPMSDVQCTCQTTH